MNEHYKAFIALGRKLAVERNAKWAIRLASDGISVKEDAWNLTAMVGDSPPPTHWIRDFGGDEKVLEAINKKRQEENLPPLNKSPLSPAWQDFIKAAALEQLFFRRNTTGHVISQIIRPLRVLATCTSNEPWELRGEDISFAYEMAKEAQGSGKLADVLLGVVKVVIDANHVADVGPLYPALSLPRQGIRTKRAKFTKSADELRANLEERKKAERLPEKRAFWELVRIVFTEQPRSFLDMLRFAQAKVILLCGIRVGEASLLPADWKRVRHYHDPSGRPAGELGGYSEALMLRHFAEKQQSPNSDSIALYENTQYVPAMFEEILTETLDQVIRATQPLRLTLQSQVEGKRLLPWFTLDALVPVAELYTVLTGNPVLINLDDQIVEKYLIRYRKDFDPNVFDEMHKSQLIQAPTAQFNGAFYVFFNRLKGKITFRQANGDTWPGSRMDWNKVFLRIDELEDHLARETATKLSDTTPFRTSGGDVAIWELMFLMPKRALAEGRNGGLCDITRYWSVGRMDGAMLQHSISGKHVSISSLFETYGLKDKDRILSLKPHSLRHLQNSELFRLGVADTVISKRFNRRSVAQSYEYDHRNLAEELEQIEIPANVEIALGEKASTVARLIKAGKASGPIVQEFHKIQWNRGDEAAFAFLKTEADGFHSTPYGHCINSFTVDPCPKHLECFAGCRHLTATDLPENQKNIIILEGRLKSALEQALARPTKSIGKENQIKHAQERLEAVRMLLSTSHGQPVFPEGADLSKPNSGSRSVLDD